MVPTNILLYRRYDLKFFYPHGTQLHNIQTIKSQFVPSHTKKKKPLIKIECKTPPSPTTKKVKVKQYIKNKTKILIVKYKKPAYPSPTHHKKKNLSTEKQIDTLKQQQIK